LSGADRKTNVGDGFDETGGALENSGSGGEPDVEGFDFEEVRGGHG
jgi:hypothetical protein